MPHSEGWPDHPYHGAPGFEDEPAADAIHCVVCGEAIPEGGGVVVDGDHFCRACNNDIEDGDTSPGVES